LQKSSVNVYAGICKWLKRGAFLQKSIVLKIGKLLINSIIKNGLSGIMDKPFFVCSFSSMENPIAVMYRYMGLIRK